MKKLALGVALLLSAQNSYAGCWTKCTTRIFGECVLKTKLCNIGDDPGDAMKTNFLHFRENLVDTWHNIYGVFPDKIRNILNNNSFAILGVAFGGLDWGLLGLTLDRIVLAAKHLGTAGKVIIDEAVAQGQNWKEDFVHEIEGIYAMYATLVATNGKHANSLDLHELKLQERAAVAMGCVRNSSQPDEATKCVNTFLNEATTLFGSAVL